MGSFGHGISSRMGAAKVFEQLPGRPARDAGWMDFARCGVVDIPRRAVLVVQARGARARLELDCDGGQTRKSTDTRCAAVVPGEEAAERDIPLDS